MRTTVIPVGVEHKMINNELASPVEKVEKVFFALRSLEHVALLDPLPRQIAAPLAKLVAQSCEFFLLFQQFLSRFDPFPMRHNLMVLQHASLLPRHGLLCANRRRHSLLTAGI